MKRVALAAVLLASTVAAQDIVLEKGREAGRKRRPDHWSRWNPPLLEELPPGAKVHIVQKGDTLWDLAATYLGDPYYWPQIWQENPYIGDPHWIYPGDPIVIPQPMLISEVVPVEPEFGELPPPVPVAYRYDVYCAPYIVPAGTGVEGGKGRLEPTFADANGYLETRHGKSYIRSREGKLELMEVVVAAPAIGATEEPRVDLSEGNIVYLNRGENQGVKAGDEFFAVRPERTVHHPDDRHVVGVVMQMVGTLKVLCTQEDTATAVITSSCEHIAVGDLIKPFEPIPIPLASSFEATPRVCQLDVDRPHGSIVHAKATRVALSPGDLVNLDLGSEQGVVPGDFLTAYRGNPLGARYPDVILGDLVVLMVEDQTATAKVVAGWTDMKVGDRVRLR